MKTTAQAIEDLCVLPPLRTEEFAEKLHVQLEFIRAKREQKEGKRARSARPKNPEDMTPNELLDTIDEIVTIAPDSDTPEVIDSPGADDAYDEPTMLEDGEISDELLEFLREKERPAAVEIEIPQLKPAVENRSAVEEEVLDSFFTHINDQDAPAPAADPAAPRDQTDAPGPVLVVVPAAIAQAQEAVTNDPQDPPAPGRSGPAELHAILAKIARL